MSLPKVSIIIALHTFNHRFKEDLKAFFELNYPDYELLIISDGEVELSHPLVKLLSTKKSGPTPPGEKRNLGVKMAEGHICAFIDDDAYPHRDWLHKGVSPFSDPEVGAVGGPGISPPHEGLWERASGAVYASPLCSGSLRYRFSPGRKRMFVDDYPAFNLLVRKELLEAIGGFKEPFYGGEDTALCLDIIQEGKKVLYEPEAMVYHHRRPLFKAHLSQVWNVGTHRGFFVKAFPQTSLRLVYFMPSIIWSFLVMGFLLLILLNRSPWLMVFPLGAYYFFGLFSALPSHGLAESALTGLGIMATHATYGLAFLMGLLKKRLKR